MTITYVEKSPAEREVRCRCGFCGVTESGIVQSPVQDPVTGLRNLWNPPAATVLVALGWHVDGERWFCGKDCFARWSYAQKREVTVTPVLSVKDAGYAKRMYAAPPASSAPVPAVIASADVPATAKRTARA